MIEIPDISRKPVKERFAGKAAIVTGGSAGIGRAIAEELCREGARVVFTGRNEADGRAAEEEMRARGMEARFVPGDMGEDGVCERIVAETVQVFGRIDCLVNNAFSFRANHADATREDWDHIFRTGPAAYALMISLCAGQMKNQGGGAVVNMSSVSAHIAQKKRWTYNAAKGAVHQLTRCAALDLAPSNIRVNSVSPALIWTRELQKTLDMAPDREQFYRMWGDFHMLRRIGVPVECAGPVLFLLSDDASFITGADLPVDGGYLAMGPQGLGLFTPQYPSIK